MPSLLSCRASHFNHLVANMSNLKMIIDNAAARAVMSATPVTPGMSAAAMLNDTKSNVCRATGTTLDITMTWPSAETIGGVHAPWCNQSSVGTIRVRGYSDEAGASQILDTGVQLACRAPARSLCFPWTAATAAVAYAYGGGSHGFVWFANTNVRRLVITLADVGSLQGYIEVARLVVGKAWSPANNASYNPGLTTGGSSAPFRTDAGDRRSVRGTKHFKLSIDLSSMEEADRVFIWGMLVANGIDVPIVISLYPGDAAPERERDHQMYGVLVQSDSVRRPNFAYHTAALEWESM